MGLEKIKHYFQHGLWDFSLHEQKGWSLFYYKTLRIGALAVRRFIQDIRKLRSWWRLFSDYFALMLIAPLFYTGSDSKIGNRQGGCLHLCQAKPTPKQPNLNKLGDGGGHKGNAKPTQHKPIFESRAVYFLANTIVVLIVQYSEQNRYFKDF